ncbi:unnamed protein product, partial [Brachionus calyciflorus]
MLDSNVIQHSKSPWASPVVLVGKKDGSIRFCVDYRALNKVTKRDVYPLPRVDDSLNSFGKTTIFSVLDLISGYWQIPMVEEDREKTAFISHCGLYEFLAMPFGLTNAPATFQRYMDAAFGGLKWLCCLVYLDDVIVFSKDFEDHIKHLSSNYARETYCLYELTHNDSVYRWTEAHEATFQNLKDILIACDKGLGGVLCQEKDGVENVVHYISRVLQPAEKKWSGREKEALGILWSCETFRPFIIGTSFIVETDHESLKWLMNAKSPARLVRWALRLSEFDFEIRYKRGSKNTNADGLSRLADQNEELQPVSEGFLAISEIGKTQHGRRTKERSSDNRFLTLNEKNLLLVPQHLIQIILEHYHCEELTHVGRDKLFTLIKAKFYWGGMYEDVRRYVQACIKCNMFKKPQPTNQGLLQPIRSSYPFEIVGMDIVGPLRRTSRGFRYILVIVDYFTNWVEACALKSLEAAEVVERFYQSIITRHGCSNKIITDQGTQFTSDLFKKLCSKLKINNVYGRDPVLPADLQLGVERHEQPDDSDDKVNYKLNLLNKLRTSYEQVELRQERAINYYKAKYDKKQRDISFENNDLVLIYWPIPKKGFTQKLLPKWQGPYRIVKRLSPTTYRVERDGKEMAVH